MTFDNLVFDIADRLGLTSGEAYDRLGRAVNRHARRITSSVGLNTSRRVTVTADTVIGDDTVLFEGVEKVIAVRVPGRRQPIDEVTQAQLAERPMRDGGLPTAFAVQHMGANSVRITLDTVPSTVVTLTADAYGTMETLEADMEPAFAESFHDAVIEAVMADEYRKMEKMDLANTSAAASAKVVSDLRMFIAKSGYKRIRQGDNAPRWVRYR